MRLLRAASLVIWLALPWAALAAALAKGADVSWVTQQEAAGQVFRDARGAAAEPFALLARMGVNAIRLRVWVNPKDGWCNAEDTLRKARRAAAAGQRLMIDFHYSDTWADPKYQGKPAAWAGHDLGELKLDVARHTREVLAALKAEGLAVEWVQVGNEIDHGLLWPSGRTSEPRQLVALLNSGYDAVKSVYPNALVVLHLANGAQPKHFHEFFDMLRDEGARWDAIGLSHYPAPDTWRDQNAALAHNLRGLIDRYGKPVVVAELGMEAQRAAAAREMIADLTRRLRAIGPQALGLFYWEPQAAPDWKGYGKGALDASGRFTEALAPFAD